MSTESIFKKHAPFVRWLKNNARADDHATYTTAECTAITVAQSKRPAMLYLGVAVVMYVTTFIVHHLTNWGVMTPTLELVGFLLSMASLLLFIKRLYHQFIALGVARKHFNTLGTPVTTRNAAIAVSALIFILSATAVTSSLITYRHIRVDFDKVFGAANNGAVNNGAANNGAVNNGATNNGAVNNGAANNGAANNGVDNNGVANNGVSSETFQATKHGFNNAMFSDFSLEEIDEIKNAYGDKLRVEYYQGRLFFGIPGSNMENRNFSVKEVAEYENGWWFKLANVSGEFFVDKYGNLFYNPNL